MIIINHRCNSLQDLNNTSPVYGCEIDIRNHGTNLYVIHDAFDPGGIELSEWLSSYEHDFLIINVKEEGLEERLFPLLDTYGVDRYFILDESFPYIRKWALKGFSKFAVRVSDLESELTSLRLQDNLRVNGGRVDWVWVDTFGGKTLDKGVFLSLASAGYRICLVSPELHWLGDSVESCATRISKFIYELMDIDLKPDAVCTRNPTLWTKLWAL